LHPNSIDVLPDGNLLVSARHTWAMYKLDRRSGRVIWRLGGKRSNFALGAGARFAFQHDARQLANGSISVFDDGADYSQSVESQSRAIVLRVDSSRRTVDLAQSLEHHGPLL